MSITINKNNDDNISVAIVKNGSPGKHVEDIIKELNKLNITCVITDFKTNNFDTPDHYKNNIWAPVTIWRSSSLDNMLERPSLRPYLDSTYMINESVFKNPFVTEKYYQQQIISKDTNLARYHIPTYRFNDRKSFNYSIDKKILEFPILAKPNSGSKGNGIHILQSKIDFDKLKINISNYVFQKFIKNKGDWRVIVLGGRSLGVLHRVGNSEFSLNNISKGASGYVVKDVELISKLYRIAERAASLFDLRFSGVDIIRDSESGLFKILEVNTAPQWLGSSGFKSVTGVNVAQELAIYTKKILDFLEWKNNGEKLFQSNKSNKALKLDTDATLCNLIDNYLQTYIIDYSAKSFHYHSRKWLWNGCNKAREVLDNMQNDYIGIKSSDWIEKITALIDETSNKNSKSSINKPHRASSLLKYPNLKKYNSVLFKVMFAESIYGIDLRPIVKSRINDASLIKMFHELMLDKDAIRLLSTPAINFMYLLRNYFKKDIKKLVTITIDPLEILDISKSYEDLIENGFIDRTNSIMSKIYLLTHAVIGESQFYQRKVFKRSYRLMCQEINDIIKNNYFQATLDNKCEFLVCCKLAGYKSDLEAIIKEECLNSISKQGLFIVDRDITSTDHLLSLSEHRNVLYVMSQTKMNLLKYRNLKKSFNNKKELNKSKIIIGRLAKVEIPIIAPSQLVARIDTGAANSSICATDIKESSGNLYFKLLEPSDPFYSGQVIRVTDYKIAKIKTAQGKEAFRYEISIKVRFMGEDIQTDFNLVDRSHMIYPLILGRKFLKGRFIVDPAIKFYNGSRSNEYKKGVL